MASSLKILSSQISSFLADSPNDVIDRAVCGTDVGAGAIGCNDRGIFGSGGVLEAVILTVIYIVGAIAVLMIVVGALRYVLSGGDQSRVKGAKDTILYAVIGLVLALLSWGIVAFVLTRVG